MLIDGAEGSAKMRMDLFGKASTIEELDETKYEKPEDGIPKTDLAEGVQDSLGLADTALQASDIEGKLDTSTFTAYSSAHANDDVTPYTGGTGISVSNHQISCTGDITPYTAGSNITVTGHSIGVSDSFASTVNGKLDASATTNWDVTPYTAGANISIANHVISGKDWSNDIDSAIRSELKEAMLRSDEIAGGIKPRIFGTNWFDQSNMLAGKWVSYENGILNDHPDYSCSQLTPIEENTTYHAKNATNGSQIAFYDINLDFVGGALLYNQPDTEFQTPAGARFARYCTETANLTNFYVVKDPTIMRKDTYHFRGWYEGIEILVAKDGSGDFTTLTEAATYAVDGDVIHVKAGVYDNEAVQLFGKTVTVYGDGCLNTIIKNGWNTYSKAPIEMATGVLRDIQFYAFDGGSPSQDPSGATAYALHADSDTSYGKTFTVERCVFISEKGNSAIGVGIYGGCDYIFRDCIIVGGISTPFFVHDSTNPQYVGVMELELYNNTFVSFGNGSFGIGTARLNGTTVYLTACGNSFQDNGPGSLPHLFTDENPSGTATGNTNINVVNWNIKPLNNGNNLPILNGDYQYATKGADWIDHGTFDAARIPTNLPNVSVAAANYAAEAAAAASGSTLETQVNKGLAAYKETYTNVTLIQGDIYSNTLVLEVGQENSSGNGIRLFLNNNSGTFEVAIRSGTWNNWMSGGDVIWMLQTSYGVGVNYGVDVNALVTKANNGTKHLSNFTTQTIGGVDMGGVPGQYPINGSINGRFYFVNSAASGLLTFEASFSTDQSTQYGGLNDTFVVGKADWTNFDDHKVTPVVT